MKTALALFTHLISLCTILGFDWLCRLESVSQISASIDKKMYENSLRNVMLEVLLDQDSAIVNAFSYCLQVTKIVNR